MALVVLHIKEAVLCVASCRCLLENAGFCKSDPQIISCLITGSTFEQRRRDRFHLLKETTSLQEAESHRSHRELLCSCLREAASRAFLAPNASVRAHLKIFKNRSGVSARGVKTNVVRSARDR